jgi:hypothetical protein
MGALLTHPALRSRLIFRRATWLGYKRAKKFPCINKRNVALYPAFQVYFRKYKPPFLAA